MPFPLKHWTKLHAVDARALRARWSSNPDIKGGPRDALLDVGRFGESSGVWTVNSELELIRLIGALQWHNPALKLWFRGEAAYFGSARPSRARECSAGQSMRTALAWLDTLGSRDRALRDRSPLARLAVLQHYGFPTLLLDVSASYEVACAFAFDTYVGGQSHLRVYAVPRHQSAVSVLDDVDVVVVDLSAELPSYCARPHAQQAAFIARREAVYCDLSGEPPIEQSAIDVDPLCIAHIYLNFDGRARFYVPRARVLYPPASTGCFNCEKPPDMNGDYLLHILQCYDGSAAFPKPDGFPDGRAGACSRN